MFALIVIFFVTTVTCEENHNKNININGPGNHNKNISISGPGNHNNNININAPKNWDWLTNFIHNNYDNSNFSILDNDTDVININIINNKNFYLLPNIKKVKVDPAQFEGAWSVTDTNGMNEVVTITQDGEISLLGKKSVLQPSDNQVVFPSSEGWMKAINLFGDNIWTYCRMTKEGKLEIHNFSTDDCNESYKNLKQYCRSGTGTKVKVDPAQFEGVWSVTDTNGTNEVVTIKQDGEISLLGKKSVLQPSDNQVDFPSSEGWMKAPNLFGDNTWTYCRMTKEGKLEIHNFGTDGCNESYNNLQQYCRSGTGTKVTILVTVVALDPMDNMREIKDVNIKLVLDRNISVPRINNEHGQATFKIEGDNIKVHITGKKDGYEKVNVYKTIVENEEINLFFVKHIKGYQIVLGWGRHHKDLDLHTVHVPSKCHTSEIAKDACKGMTLDLDNWDGGNNGVETISVEKRAAPDGNNLIYVLDYTNYDDQSHNALHANSTLKTSEAYILLYGIPIKGAYGSRYARLNVPKPTHGEFLFWVVGCFNKDNGFTKIDKLTNTIPFDDKTMKFSENFC